MKNLIEIPKHYIAYDQLKSGIWKCPNCKDGALFNIPQSKLAENIGISRYECDKCKQIYISHCPEKT